MDARSRYSVPMRFDWLARPATLLPIFTLAALVVYWPSLGGPYMFDDIHYVATNIWVRDLDATRLLELLDPWGAPALIVENYAPVNLLLHSAVVWFAGDAFVVHHAVNLLLHALASVLVVLVLRRAGVPDVAAIVAGAFFLLHPANVEAVAWISQLKTTSSLVLVLWALLAFERFPLPSAGLFAAALLAKASAVFALPALAVFLFCLWRREGERPSPRYTAGLALWAGVLVVFVVVELAVFTRLNAMPPGGVPDDPLVQVRTALGILPHYLLMATTGLGLSAFHQPPHVISWTDPRWILGASAAILIGIRALRALVRGDTEAAFWAWVIVAYLPISQLFPFRYPIADRYLYPVLPGLLGAALLAFKGPLTKLLGTRGPPQWVCGVLVVAGLTAFAFEARPRANLWRHPLFVLQDAARNYPDSDSAHLLIAGEQTRAGERDAAVRSLRLAYERGIESHGGFARNPCFSTLTDLPEFQQLIHEMAGQHVRRLHARGELIQVEYLGLVEAHLARGEHDLARRAAEQGLAVGGSFSPRLRELQATIPRDLPRRRPHSVK